MRSYHVLAIVMNWGDKMNKVDKPGAHWPVDNYNNKAKGLHAVLLEFRGGVPDLTWEV